jgi:predicted permease
MDEEFRFHQSIEAMQQHHAAHGLLTTAEARARARRRFGNTTYHKEESRTMSGLGFFDTVSQDLRFAFRTLRRTPGFTIIAILTLALGIGANTAIFSAVDAMLLRPLPYRAPDRLMLVSVTVPANHGRPPRDDVPWSYMKAQVLREGQRVFSDLTLFTNETVTLQQDVATREEAEVVDEHYLPTLGVQPAQGRNFLAEENRPNGKRVVVVSDRFWQARLNADPNVLGKTLDIEGAPYSVIGVLPPRFAGLTGHADFWFTIGARRAYMFNPNEAWDHEFSMLGRLAPGVTSARARNDVATLGKRANDAFPERGMSVSGWGATAKPLDRARVDPIIRRSLLVLLGAVVFVLLIACANLANLFLVRSSARQREIAVRLAIGAARRRLVRQLLTETLLLAVIGGLAGLTIAWWGARTLSTLDPERSLGTRGAGLGVVQFATIHLDWRALLFAGAATVLTALLFGLVPAMQATRPSLTAALKDGTADHGLRAGLFRRLTTRNALAVLELALALVLLAGSGVMVHSLTKLMAVDLGFEPRSVLTLRISTTVSDDHADSATTLYQTFLARLRGLPGVQSAALGNCPPLVGGCNGTIVWVGGRGKEQIYTGSEPHIGVEIVTPEWFKTLRVPLLAGRLLTDTDRGGGKVMVINATAAHRLWPNESAVGKMVGIGMGGWDSATVVGVVGDVRFNNIDSLPASDAYVSYYQATRSNAIVFLRTAIDPKSLAAPARAAIRELAPSTPVYEIRTLESRVSDAMAQARFSATLLTLFAGAALVLAVLGIYGVMAFGVSQRTREIGIRIALGAERGDVVRLVVGQGAALTALGLGLGLIAALSATQLLRSLLYDVAPSDPTTFAAVVAILGVAGVLASWLPARRAARLEPTEALRD